eukprot:SAG11_NODE_7971_length_1075_cov_1.500000_2_plen_155_part_01
MRADRELVAERARRERVEEALRHRVEEGRQRAVQVAQLQCALAAAQSSLRWSQEAAANSSTDSSEGEDAEETEETEETEGTEESQEPLVAPPQGSAVSHGSPPVPSTCAYSPAVSSPRTPAIHETKGAPPVRGESHVAVETDSSDCRSASSSDCE